MVDKKIYLVGFLTIIILISGVVYINLDNLKIRCDFDKTTFYVLEDSRWRVAGREINSIWEGTTKMNRNRKEITINTTIKGNITKIVRETPYLRGALIRDTYSFRGDIKDKELFPVSHKIEVINGNICGKKECIYQYEVRDLIYSGETKKLKVNEMSFGRNMKVEWDNKFYYAKIYKYKNQDKGKLTIRYRIKSDYEVFYNRLFDPTASNTTLTLDGLSQDRYYELGTICELKANVTNSTGDLIYNPSGNNICLDIDQVDYGDNYICGNGSVAYNLTTNAVKNTFNDSSLSKNLTYNSAPENKTFYLNFNKYDDIQSAYINLTGYENASYPLNPKIYVNDTLVNELGGSLIDSQGYINELNDENISKNLTYDNAGNKIIYISIPKNATIINATLNLTGYESGEMKYSEYYFNVVHNCIYLGNNKQGSPGDITYYGDYFYINDEAYCGNVYRYNYPSGSYTDSKALINIENSDGITTNGTEIWVSYYLRYNITHYYLNGTYIDYWIPGGNVTPGALANNNTFFWIADLGWGPSYPYDYSGRVFKYWMNTSYTGEYFMTNVTDSKRVAISGITTNNEYIWVLHNLHVDSPDKNYSQLVKFWMNGTYTNIFYNITESLYGNLGGLENDGTYFWISDDKNNRVYRYWMNHYPNNIILDTGNDGSSDYTNSGEIVNSISVDLNITAIQNYLDSSSCKGFICDVPIAISSNTTGTLEISNINITYSYNPININATAIQNYLDAQSPGYHNVPIKISSETNTTIQIDNINITYFGSDNISVTAHFDGDGTYSASNDTQIVMVQYSDFEISLPSLYPSDELVWMPSSNSEKNCTPYGQTSNVPAYNITHLNYDQNMNISIRLNESLNSCINLTVSATNNKSEGFIMNTSYQDVSTDISFGNYSNMFFWADLQSCNRSVYAYFNPYGIIQGCCSQCICN